MKEVVKAAVTTGSAAALGMLFAAITGKIISMVAGPSGIGLYSVLLQLHAAAVAFASFGGGGNAVTQGIASRVGEDRDRFIVTSAWAHVATAAIVAIGMIVAAPSVPRLLGVESAVLTHGTVRALTVTMAVGVLVVYVSGLVNGFREIGALARNRVMSSLTVALLAWPAALLERTGNYLAFVALITSGLVVQATGLVVIVARKSLFRFRHLLRRDLLAVDPLRHFSAVAGTFFAAGQVAHLSTLLITAMVVRASGLPGAGLLNVAVTISTGYLMLVLGSFGTYYSPTLSAAADQAAVQKVIRDVLAVSMLASVPIIVSIIVLKPVVLLLLYTSEFLPALKVLRWMLIGDYLKIFSWVFAMPLSARAVLKSFLGIEIALVVAYYLLTRLFLPTIGAPEAVGVAFTLSYALYLLVHVWYARRLWSFVWTRREVLVWSLGLLLIVAASASHWNAVTVRPVEASLWILTAAMMSWWGIGQDTRQRAVSLVRRRLGR